MSVAWRYTPPAVNAIPVVRAAAEAAVDAAARIVLDASRDDVPVEEGVLKASGRVVADGLTAAVTYGRDDDGHDGHAPSNQYAVIQHEDMTLNHPNGGGPKFLEGAMHGEAAHVAETLVAGIRKVIGR